MTIHLKSQLTILAQLLHQGRIIFISLQTLHRKQEQLGGGIAW